MLLRIWIAAVIVFISLGVGNFFRASMAARSASHQIAHEPFRICPTCQGIGKADPLPESADPSGLLYHAEGSAWLPPSSREHRSPYCIIVPARCPRCQGRGIIGG